MYFKKTITLQMDKKISELLESSKFTTSKITRCFLPRRVGLGYDLNYENKELDIIKQCKKHHHKFLKKIKDKKQDIEDEETLLSKSKTVK